MDIMTILDKIWTNLLPIAWLVGLIIVLFAILLRQEKRKSKYYDERQILAQNNAYKYAFYSLLFYNLFCYFLDLFGIKWAEPSALSLIGLALSTAVFNVICVLNDAYEGVNKQRSSYSILHFILGAICLVLFIDDATRGNIFTDSLLNYKIFSLYLAVTILSTYVAQFAKKHFCKKEDNEE